MRRGNINEATIDREIEKASGRKSAVDYLLEHGDAEEKAAALRVREAVACAQIGIRMETLVDWLENKPKFAQRYAKAKSDIQVLATERLLKFTGRDPRAAQYFHVQVNADFRSSSNGGAAAAEKPPRL